MCNFAEIINFSDNTINVVITIVTTIFTAGVGGIIGYLSARRISTLNARKSACINLRKAFAPALAKMKIGWDARSGHANTFLKEEVFTQAIAVEEFRVFVPKRKRGKYQKTWDDYQQAISNMSPEVFQSSIYYDLIHEILQFANDGEE
jgi:hypothetical protein